MTQENTQGNRFTKAKHFWNSQSLFGKHLLGLILAFIGVPGVIVLGKLGFRELAMFVMLLDGSLIFWASGFWYVFRFLLRGLWLAVLFD